MSREAMQIALEALEKVITAFGSGLTLQQKAATALRQALETDKQWVGLTDEERIALWGMRSDGPSNSEIRGFARAIEAKLKEKNT
jgi:hypothetical protein